MTENIERETALVEAILYLETGSPLDEAAISRISGLEKDIVKNALDNLSERYAASCHGVEIAQIGGGFLISPKRDFWDVLKERYGRKNEGKVSRAALETLSIIAYSQPITRAEIEKIRGVSADNMIRMLLEKNLIRETGKKDVPGKPALYGTTRDFLKLFRLNSISELPKLDESDLEKFQLEGER